MENVSFSPFLEKVRFRRKSSFLAEFYQKGGFRLQFCLKQPILGYFLAFFRVFPEKQAKRGLSGVFKSTGPL
jgi:hypothetical protein